LPGLKRVIGSILATKSLEAFRRKVEHAIRLLENESIDEELSIMGTKSGAGLGFMLSQSIPNGLAKLFDRFAIVASVARRRIVAGRCRPLQRYAVASGFGRMQRRVASCIVAMHDGLDIKRS
jgi:hypothetical protein